MSDCLHDPEEYTADDGSCELCALRDHPARKAMVEALFEEQYGYSTEFAGERMELTEEVVDHMLSAAAAVGWTLHSAADEELVDDE